MIDPTHFSLLLVGMAWNKKNDPLEDEFKWKPTREEANELRNALQKFKVQKIGGRNWYAFEQYCLSLGIIKELNGYIVVRSPEEWRKKNDLWDYMKWEDQKNLEMFFQANPEERVAYEQRLQAIVEECRKVIHGMKVA